MKRFRTFAAAGVAVLAAPLLAYAAGNWSTLPIVGGASFCASTVTGTGNLGGITGQGQGTTGSICAQTVPAGPPAITGNETIPADTNLGGGAPPQTVTIQTGALAAIGQGAMRNLLVGGDFYVNPFQRGTTFSSLTPTTAALTADRFAVYSSGNTVTIAKKTTGADISAATNILASLQINRPSGSDVTPICIGQILPATETQNLLGRNAVFSWYGLNGSAMSASNGAVQATIAYATAADSATPGTNTDAWMKGTITGYTAVTTLSPNTVGSVASAVATVPQSTTWTRYSVYGAIPTTATTVGVKLCYTPVGTGGANDYFDIARVQLEATNQVSAGGFAHRPSAMEKQLAQAYSFVLTDGAATLRYGLGQATTTTNANFVVNFPVPMRITPTTTVGTSASWQATVAAGTAQACTALAGVSTSNTLNTGTLACTVAANLTAGSATQMIGQATGGLLTFSAEP